MKNFLKSLFGKSESQPQPAPESAPAVEALPKLSTTDLLEMSGVDWQASHQESFLAKVVTGHADEKLKTALINQRFTAAHRKLSRLDAAVLHGLVLEREPSRIMELGCGASSYIVRNALKIKNLPAEFIIVDEDLPGDFGDLLDAHLDDPLTDVPASDFEIMIAGEMVLAHLDQLATKPAEFRHLFAELLPALKPEIYVGFIGLGDEAANAAVSEWLKSSPEILYCGLMHELPEGFPEWIGAGDFANSLLLCRTTQQ